MQLMKKHRETSPGDHASGDEARPPKTFMDAIIRFLHVRDVTTPHLSDALAAAVKHMANCFINLLRSLELPNPDLKQVQRLLQEVHASVEVSETNLSGFSEVEKLAELSA